MGERLLKIPSNTDFLVHLPMIFGFGLKLYTGTFLFLQKKSVNRPDSKTLIFPFPVFAKIHFIIKAHPPLNPIRVRHQGPADKITETQSGQRGETLKNKKSTRTPTGMPEPECTG